MLNKMLRDAAKAGLRFRCSYGHDVDYIGSGVRAAYDSLMACDEMMLTVEQERAGKWHRIGSALIIPELDADEQIADAGGWCNDWLDENA